MANRVVCTLSLAYRLAERRDLTPEWCDSCPSIANYPERERFLIDWEFVRLEKVLEEAVTWRRILATAAGRLKIQRQSIDNQQVESNVIR